MYPKQFGCGKGWCDRWRRNWGQGMASWRITTPQVWKGTEDWEGQRKAQQVRLEDKGGNDAGQKTHLVDVLPSPLHIQGVTHLPHRIPWANRSLLILTLLLSFISFVYPVPLPEATYKPFSWSHVVLPQMIHPQNSPLADKAVSRQDLTKPLA